jgi:hypothetical protein
VGLVGGFEEFEHLLDLVRNNLVVLVLDLLLYRRHVIGLLCVDVLDLGIVLLNG